MYLLPGRGTWHCRYEDPEETPVPLQSTTLADICLAVFAAHESICEVLDPRPNSYLALPEEGALPTTSPTIVRDRRPKSSCAAGTRTTSQEPL